MSTDRLMKKDCRKFLHEAILVCFFHRLFNIASPTLAAWLIGDMTSRLLELDTPAILAGLPAFLSAVFVQVVIVAVFRLRLNLLLTRQGFAYDSFLMEKLIHLPMIHVETMEAGAVMERLEEDAAAFCWNQMTLCAYPAVASAFALVLMLSFWQNGCPILFVLTILAMAALPIIRTAYIAKEKAKLKKEISEYNEGRRQMEQELFQARDLAKSFSLHNYFTGRLERHFERFLQKTGKRQYRLDAKTAALDFLCTYGTQLCTILVGAFLAIGGKLSLGMVLAGYLTIPSITQCFQYVRDLITEKHDEGKYLSRIACFYGDYEDARIPDAALTALDAEKLCFSYPGEDTPVLFNVDFSMTKDDNIRFVGPNGSGKSTLLSILAGLYEPVSGQVCRGATARQRQQSVALQDQNGTIFSGTIWDNLFLSEDKRPEAEKLLCEMGLTKNLEDAVSSGGSSLSPGEQKKILLARALLRDANFLLLDEPINHLDANAAEVLNRLLLRRQGGLLIISHSDAVCAGLHMKPYYFN